MTNPLSPQTLIADLRGFVLDPGTGTAAVAFSQSEAIKIADLLEALTDRITALEQKLGHALLTLHREREQADAMQAKVTALEEERDTLQAKHQGTIHD
jgi:Asp-tRNA(Asn)/Glu-tRNA(Gln) amidotransferase A subunit family amidase